jgi:hypothetical protein
MQFEFLLSSYIYNCIYSIHKCMQPKHVPLFSIEALMYNLKAQLLHQEKLCLNYLINTQK